MTRDEQFAYIETARRQILTWVQSNGVLLHRVEYVVPFVESDFGLAAWFFFKTDEELRKVSAGGREGEIKSAFVDILRSVGYASEWIDAIIFEFYSHENVEKNYERSYFYRLR